jgi:glycolate oxidase iron-sulfur subunit
MHLVDHARAHIEETYRRPLSERALRSVLAHVMPYPRRLQFALGAASLAKPLAPLASALGLSRVAALLELAPWRHPHGPLPAQIFPPAPIKGRAKASAKASSTTGAKTSLKGGPKARVALLAGCVNDVLAPELNAAAIRVLTRQGIEVVLAAGAGCCGSLAHHMGREEQALTQARANIEAWSGIGDLDAILVTASGCGTTIKDYGFMLRGDPAYAERAARVSKLTKDITEYLAALPLAAVGEAANLVVAYHSACSLQHGQRVTRQPKEILTKVGFIVKDVPDGHLCCGSAGTYNILQPNIARRLRERKVGTIERLRPDVIAAGNLGCIMQIAAGTDLPTVHTVELIDWATGGPCPPVLREHRSPSAMHPSTVTG